ncbi:MAG: hypothetical protein ISS26_00035 [Candidatus Omnitrophica bacterium]|nr:hypothetical protein [Candidatus Omnitrophota bacterium]
MRKILIFLSFLIIASSGFAEMPVTVVTPDNIDKFEIQFFVSIIGENVCDKGVYNYKNILLTLTPKKKNAFDNILIHSPILDIKDEIKLIAKATLFDNGYEVAPDAKRPKFNPKARYYWFSLNPELIKYSSVSVVVLPKKPKNDKNLCVQSMKYILELRDYIQ